MNGWQGSAAWGPRRCCRPVPRARRCPRCWSGACSAASATGTGSSTTPAWRWRWRAPPLLTARWWSITCGSRACGWRAHAYGASTHEMPRLARCSRSRPAAWSTPPGCGWTGCAARRPSRLRAKVRAAMRVSRRARRRAGRRARRRRPWSRPARACTWWWTGLSCLGPRRSWCPRRLTVGCCSPCPGWARPCWAPPTRRAATSWPSPVRSPTRWTSSCARRRVTFRVRPPAPMCARPGWVCARWFALPPRPAPKAGRLPRRAACRASTRWRWAPPGWSPSRVASGPPTGPWPRTCWRPAWRRACCPSARAVLPSICCWWARRRGARCASPRASTCTAARPRSCAPCWVLIAGWRETRRAARAC